ncbi:hypothetical protein HB763_19305 [Vibrio campbellii]|uniref:hypothetical protein n=1 Tax=Vibrio campbellii TaxID=680 RepID=UPI00210E6581|nr:hypothetical protein [Vibrio campbellii]UTZ38754.1 hypothetical protein HB763_19305 [Vibrio campbellii]
MSGVSTDVNPSVLENTNTSGPQNIGFLITDKDGKEVLNSVYDYPYSDIDMYIPYDVSLFNTDGIAANGGLVSGVAVFTTSYM